MLAQICLLPWADHLSRFRVLRRKEKERLYIEHMVIGCHPLCCVACAAYFQADGKTQSTPLGVFGWVLADANARPGRILLHQTDQTAPDKNSGRSI